MVQTLLIFCTQDHTYVFRSYGGGGECLKRILTYLYCTKYNEIIMYHSDVYKSIFRIQNGMYNTKFSRIGSHKRVKIYRRLKLEAHFKLNLGKMSTGMSSPF